MQGWGAGRPGANSLHQERGRGQPSRPAGMEEGASAGRGVQYRAF